MELPHATCFCLPLGLSNQNVHACSSGCFLGASAGRSAWVSTDTISPSSTPPCSVLCPSSGLASTSAILFSLLFSNFSQSSQTEFSSRKQKIPPKKNPQRRSISCKSIQAQQWCAGKKTHAQSSAPSENVNDTDLGIAVAQCGHVLVKEKGSQSLKPPNPNPWFQSRVRELWRVKTEEGQGQ